MRLCALSGTRELVLLQSGYIDVVFAATPHANRQAEVMPSELCTARFGGVAATPALCGAQRLALQL